MTDIVLPSGITWKCKRNDKSFQIRYLQQGVSWKWQASHGTFNALLRQSDRDIFFKKLFFSIRIFSYHVTSLSTRCSLSGRLCRTSARLFGGTPNKYLKPRNNRNGPKLFLASILRPLSVKEVYPCQRSAQGLRSRASLSPKLLTPVCKLIIWLCKKLRFRNTISHSRPRPVFHNKDLKLLRQKPSQCARRDPGLKRSSPYSPGRGKWPPSCVTMSCYGSK
jgi:hypothetical protein